MFGRKVTLDRIPAKAAAILKNRALHRSNVVFVKVKRERI